MTVKTRFMVVQVYSMWVDVEKDLQLTRHDTSTNV
jgi:hypothetical protein